MRRWLVVVSLLGGVAVWAWRLVQELEKPPVNLRAQWYSPWAQDWADPEMDLYDVPPPV